MNWVWYQNVAEGSSEMKKIFTDANGKVHANTISQGLVSPAVWEPIRAAGVSRMAAPFAELIGKTKQPFVTKVNDVLCTKARYCDGRVLLVGDAMTSFRPNVAMATEQAAKHCLWMGQARRGEMTMEEWEWQVAAFAKRFILVGRLTGDFGLGSTFSFLRSLYRYLRFMIGLKRGKL